MDKFRLKLRIVLWSFLALAATFFIYKFLAPDGRIAYQTDFRPAFFGGRGFIEKFTPAERVVSENGLLKIFGDPVYFSLFTPRKFESAKMTVIYKNLDPEKYPVVEAGLLMDNIAHNYDLQPLQNNILDKFSSQWTVIRDGSTLFLQREKKFNSLADFLQSDVLKAAAGRRQVALYNYDLSAPAAPSVAAPAGPSNKSAAALPALRGTCQFYDYLSAPEDLNINFDFLNLHEDPAPDTIIVNVYDPAGRQIFSQSLADQGQINIALKKLPAGIYKVEVRASDDIITRKITASDYHLAFINKVWLVDGANVWTDNNKIKVKNVNPKTRGQIIFGGEKFNIDETYKQFNLTVSAANPAYKIEANGDYILETEGVFSFDPGALFNPNFRRVSVDLDLSNIDYIIANYRTPTPGGGYEVATAGFSLSNAYREFGKNTFMISIPGLTTADAGEQGITAPGQDNSVPEGSGAALEIKDIKIELIGRSLFDMIRELWQKK
jgi:hypothetical protein